MLRILLIASMLIFVAACGEGEPSPGSIPKSTLDNVSKDLDDAADEAQKKMDEAMKKMEAQ